MNWLSILGIILIFAGTLFTYYGGIKSDEKTQKELTEKIDAKDSTLTEMIQTNQELIDQNANLVTISQDISKGQSLLNSKNSDLLIRQTDLLGRIEGYQKELENKNQLIEELRKAAKTTGRGEAINILFNGDEQRSTGSSLGYVTFSHRNGQLRTINEAFDGKKFKPVIDLCDVAISESPKWMTPYYFKALALMNLGSKPEGLKLLEFIEFERPADKEFIPKLIGVYEQLGETEKVIALKASLR